MTNTDDEWFEKLTQEEKEWIQTRLMSDPAKKHLSTALNLLVNEVQQADLKKIFLKLQVWEERFSKHELAPDENTPINSDLKRFTSTNTQWKNVDNAFTSNTVTLRSWKTWAIAATITLMTFAYLFLITQQPPRPMDCLISVSSLNNCF
jgi:hypothetical protein